MLASPDTEVIHEGVVKWFDGGRGCGLISVAGVSDEVFVEYTQIKAEGLNCLSVYDCVSLKIAQNDIGYYAFDVKKL
jgi:cold shock CspA family protein